MRYALALAIRSLGERPLRSLLTAFAIVLGVAVILATSITNLSTLDSITSLFAEASGKAQLVVISASTDEQGFSDRILRRLHDVPGVAAAVPSVHVQTLPAAEASLAQMAVDVLGAATSGLTLYGIDAESDIQVRDYDMVSGRFLSLDSTAREVVLVDSYAEEEAIGVGSDLEIITPEGFEQLRVVGLMSKEGPGRLNNGAFGVLPLATAQALFARPGELNQIDVMATADASDATSLDKLKAALQAALGDSYAVTYPASRGQRVTQMLDTYQLGLGFFSVVALFVGAFLIYNAFSMNVVERTREIGLLRAVGMTRRQVTRQILLEASILGLVGSGLGVGAGILLSRGLIRAMELVLTQEVRLVRVPLDGLATSMVVGVGATLVAATVPSLQASRVSPVEALRARAEGQDSWLVRRGWPWGAALMLGSYASIFWLPGASNAQYRLGRVAILAMFVGATLLMPATIRTWERISRPVIRRTYGNEGWLGSSNIQRARARTTLTTAALMIGVAMILGIQGLTGAFENGIQSWVEAYIGGDLYVYSSVLLRSDLGRRLEAVDGVAAATPVRYLDVDRVKPDGASEPIVFMGVDPQTYTQVTSFVFSDQQVDPGVPLHELGQDRTLFVSTVMSEKYGLMPGDILRLQTRRGVQEFAVAAVVADYYNRGLVVQGSWWNLWRYFGVNDANVYLLKLEPGHEAAIVQKRIEELYGQRRHLTVDSNQELKAEALGLTAQVFSLFDVLALIAVAVAALGVVNTLMMNVSERTREIGALRAMGMTRGQVRRMIMAEAAIIGLIGGLFGLAFGLVLSRVFLTALTVMRGYQLTYVLPTQAIAIGLLIAVIVSQVAAVLPARRASRLLIVEAIQYE